MEVTQLEEDAAIVVAVKNTLQVTSASVQRVRILFDMAFILQFEG
jgi:hypothetical protein